LRLGHDPPAPRGAPRLPAGNVPAPLRGVVAEPAPQPAGPRLSRALHELRRGRCSEPGGQGVTKAMVRARPDPRDVSVGSNQQGNGSGHGAECRQLPRTPIPSVDPPNPIRPWTDVEGAGLAEIEQ